MNTNDLHSMEDSALIEKISQLPPNDRLRITAEWILQTRHTKEVNRQNKIMTWLTIAMVFFMLTQLLASLNLFPGPSQSIELHGPVNAQIQSFELMCEYESSDRFVCAMR